MKIISHRGNLEGSNTLLENRIDSITKAIELGFDVEIDLWYLDGLYFLGHDGPQYEVEIEFLKSLKDKLWVHCKNLDCFESLYQSDFNFFWHDKDLTTLTSKGISWSQPDIFLKKGVTVCIDYKDIPSIYGVCTDEPIKFIIKNVKN